MMSKYVFQQTAQNAWSKCLYWISVLAFVIPMTADAQEGKVFYSPPAPQELADILFPPRTRSIVIENGSGAKPAPRLFSLLINFEFGKTDITSDSYPYLDSLGQMLNMEGLTNESIVIEGHTDAVGDYAYNQTLSEERALAVRQYLMTVHNIEEQRLHPVGKGETELYDAAQPNAAINRRVQFKPASQ